METPCLSDKLEVTGVDSVAAMHTGWHCPRKSKTGDQKRARTKCGASRKDGEVWVQGRVFQEGRTNGRGWKMPSIQWRTGHWSP